MCSSMTPGSLSLESQLMSIMDVLVKAAVVEISQLFSESSVNLRLHLSQSLKENEVLRTRMKVMRSELFSLRLQTRLHRPASRQPLGRGTSSKPRPKIPVILKPTKAQKPTEAETLQSENKSSSTATQSQCTDDEAEDVILIKDEDDVGESAPDVAGHSDFQSHSTQGSVSTDTQNLEPALSSQVGSESDELKIVNVHSQRERPQKEESDILFSPSEIQAFTLSLDHDPSPDSLLGFTSDCVPVKLEQDVVGLVRNNHLEPNTTSQLSSPAVNSAVNSTIVRAEGEMGRISHTSQFAQQHSILPYSFHKSLDCSFCGEHFHSREDLILHRASHTGESPVPCSMCGKTFVNKTTLGIHMRIHTGEKPYACSQCGKRFTQNGSLKIHLRTHSGEKPYTCNQCPASFNNPSNLRRHMVTHTSGLL